ncbi:hypothetical protein [Mesorhizobium sp. M0060]|uniref:hypothetical protein n=1 Tax=Mesorhizobium sp. M0060 TaxID=2956866 RepID=UPI0033361650
MIAPNSHRQWMYETQVDDVAGPRQFELINAESFRIVVALYDERLTQRMNLSVGE